MDNLAGAQNYFPNPDNYPVSSFRSPIPPPDVDPDEGDLLYVAYNPAWQESVDGALMQLLNPATWEGDHDAKIQALNRAETLRFLLQEPVAPPDEEIPAPYWDDDEDVDDELSIEDQPWYGYVTDPEAPPGELDFVENALLWGFTGFIALATFEVGFAPAILFNTLAKKMVLANKRGDVGEVLRIFIDGEEAARVDTTPYAAGEVIETPIIGDPALSTHEIMIVQVS